MLSILLSTAFSPRREGNSESSYLELPTLEHVSKAFRIEIWFLTHSQGKYGDFLTFQLFLPGRVVDRSST